MVVAMLCDVSTEGRRWRGEFVVMQRKEELKKKEQLFPHA